MFIYCLYQEKSIPFPFLYSKNNLDLTLSPRMLARHHQDDGLMIVLGSKKSRSPPNSSFAENFCILAKMAPRSKDLPPPGNGSSISPPQKCVFGRDMWLIPSRVTTKIRTKNLITSHDSPPFHHLPSSPIITTSFDLEPSWLRVILVLLALQRLAVAISSSAWWVEPTNPPWWKKRLAKNWGGHLNPKCVGVEILIKDFWS